MPRFGTAVITGAANGIGKELCRLLLQKGTTVHGIDLQAEALQAFEEESKKYSLTFVSHVADVTQPEALKSVLAKATEGNRKIDLWINNAGIAGISDFSQLTSEDFDRVMNVNFKAVVTGTRIALETMEENGRGTIANMASAAGYIPCPYLTAYCASKFAVVGFSRALREELKLKKSPVRIVTAAPGFVDTKMIEKGTEKGFPEWLSFLLSSPQSVGKEILRGIEKGEEDIFPTLNGKLLVKFHRFFPGVTEKSSRLLLTKNLKDLLFLRQTPP